MIVLYVLLAILAFTLSVTAALAFLSYTYGQRLLGMGRRTIARLYALSEILSMIVARMNPKGWDYDVIDAFGSVILALSLYLAWRWRNDDDDDFTKRFKRKVESIKVTFRSFAPSPIPSPT